MKRQRTGRLQQLVGCGGTASVENTERPTFVCLSPCPAPLGSSRMDHLDRRGSVAGQLVPDVVNRLRPCNRPACPTPATLVLPCTSFLTASYYVLVALLVLVAGLLFPLRVAAVTPDITAGGGHSLSLQLDGTIRTWEK